MLQAFDALLVPSSMPSSPKKPEIKLQLVDAKSQQRSRPLWALHWHWYRVSLQLQVLRTSRFHIGAVTDATGARRGSGCDTDVGRQTNCGLNSINVALRNYRSIACCHGSWLWCCASAKVYTPAEAPLYFCLWFRASNTERCRWWCRGVGGDGAPPSRSLNRWWL